VKLKKNQEDQVFDIKGFLFNLISYWPFFITSLAIALSIAYSYLRYTESIYRISTLLLVKGGEKSPMSKLLGETDLFNTDKNVANEIVIIGSYDMVYRTLKRLDFNVSYFHKGQVRNIELYNESPIKVTLDTTASLPFYGLVHIQILSDLKFRLKIGESKNYTEEFYFGIPIRKYNLNFTIVRNSSAPIPATVEDLYFIVNNITSLTSIYKGKVFVNKYYKEASLLEISSVGTIPQKEADFLNKLAEVYIQSSLDEKNQIANNSINFINEQLEEIIVSMASTENELEDFQKLHKIPDITYIKETVFAKLDGLEAEKAGLLLKMKYYNFIMDYIKNDKNISNIVAPSVIGIGDALLNNLIMQLSTQMAEKAAQSGNISSKNPYLKGLNARIENTKLNLVEDLTNLIKSTEIDLGDINERISVIEVTINKLPRTERIYLDIQRKFNLSNHIYNYLLEKRAEAGIAKASNLADTKVIEKARAWNAFQIAPKSNSVYSFALITGFIIPLIFIFGKKFINNKIISKEQIQEQTDIPILGIVGHNQTRANLIVIDKPKSSIAEAFRSIRINLQYMASEKAQKIILITSSISGEGKSFCSVNLASIIALSDKKTLLIGADLRKPKLFSDFNISNTQGLSTILANKASIDEIINHTSIPNFDIITAGPIPPNPAELIGSSKMDYLMEELKKRYDYIIIDTPPIGLVADTFLLTKYSDINIYIVRHRYTEMRLLEKIDNLFTEEKIKNISIVINDLYAQDAKYGYGYRYGYGYYHGYGYYEEDKKSKNTIKKLYKKFFN